MNPEDLCEEPYELHCPHCEVNVFLSVMNEDEEPVFCPMCGEDVNEEWIYVD